MHKTQADNLNRKKISLNNIKILLNDCIYKCEFHIKAPQTNRTFKQRELKLSHLYSFIHCDL